MKWTKSVDEVDKKLRKRKSDTDFDVDTFDTDFDVDTCVSCYSIMFLTPLVWEIFVFKDFFLKIFILNAIFHFFATYTKLCTADYQKLFSV